MAVDLNRHSRQALKFFSCIIFFTSSKVPFCVKGADKLISNYFNVVVVR